MQATAQNRVVKARVVKARVMPGPLLLRCWHLASLDAPSVAVTWLTGFAVAGRVSVPVWLMVGLALATWVAYVGDRLMDAFRGEGGEERHRFHWRHRRVMLPGMMVAACVGVGMMLAWMPQVAWMRNGLVMSAALVYFARVHSGRGLGVPKELLVAGIFTAACVLPVMARLQAGLGEMAVVAVLFALLAWLNCAAIECWERGGGVWVARTGVALACVMGVVAGALAFNGYLGLAWLSAAGAMSAGLLVVLNVLRGRVERVTLRALADAVLLTPLLAMPFLRMAAR